MKKRVFSLILLLALLLTLAPAAYAADELQYSDSLVTFLEKGEGFRAMPYGGAGGWYIGYGCACDPADYPGGITEEGAEALLRSKLDSFAASVRSFLRKYGVTVTPGQFDAMCAMSYALGPAWLSAGNRLPDYLINGISGYTANQIASAFGAWCHVGGAVSVPALERRIMEAKMFLNGDYSNSAAGWCWLILDPAGGKNAFSDVAVFEQGKPYGALPEASRSGMYFAGWQTAEGRVLSPADTVTQSLSVKALWSAVPVELPKPAEAPKPAETPPPAAPAEPALPALGFPDVPAGCWYEKQLARLCAEGVFHGYDDGGFHPNDSVDWGQALKLILLAAGYPAQTPPDSPDGAGVHWAQGYLDLAEKKGFLKKGEITDLNAKINRNAVADLCAAALELKTVARMESPFADSSRPSVLALYDAGILYGSVEDGRRLYRGENELSRSEVCSVLVCLSDYVERTLILFNEYRIPINESLRRSPYYPDCFTVKDGRISYDDGTTKSICGIDVSYYQGDIDWQKVAADGVEFAIIRCGYRGYTSGEIREDERFQEYIAGATAAGLDVGIYFFSQAISTEEALEEARFTLAQIKDYDISYPVVFDWEPVANSSSRTRNYSGSIVTDCTVAFCDAVAAAGYTPMTYFNEQMAYLKLDMKRLQAYDGWLAWYHDYPDYIYDYQMWQYGSSGAVSGIKGNVDMNIAFRDFAARS